MAKKWKMTHLTKEQFDAACDTSGMSKWDVKRARRKINDRMPDGVPGHKNTGRKVGCITFKCSNRNCGESVVSHGTVICPICGCGGNTTIY